MLYKLVEFIKDLLLEDELILQSIIQFLFDEELITLGDINKNIPADYIISYYVKYAPERIKYWYKKEYNNHIN